MLMCLGCSRKQVCLNNNLPTHRFTDLEPRQCKYTDYKSLVECDMERYLHEKQLGDNLKEVNKLLTENDK